MRRHSIIVSLLTAVLLCFFISCSLKMPGAPIWTIEATIPFSERAYKLGEMFTTDSAYNDQGWGILPEGADSLLTFSYRDLLEKQSLEDRITYEESNTGSYVNQIGIIEVEKPTPDSSQIMVSDLDPIYNNYTGPLIPFDFGPTDDMLSYEIFKWVHVQDGHIVLTVKNGFPFSLIDLDIGLYNILPQDSIDLGYPPFVLIDRATFANRIEPGAVDSARLSLNERMAHNNLLLRFSGRQPDNLPDVTIRGDETLTMVVEISETRVYRTMAQVGSQQFDTSDSLLVENPNQIVTADIKDGSVFFSLRNTTPFQLDVDLTFLNIYRDTLGNKKLLTYKDTIPPLGSLPDQVLELSGYTLEMTLADQSIRILTNAKVEDTKVTYPVGDASFVVIRGEQGVEVEYRTSDLVFNSLEGILDSVLVEIPPDLNTPIDIPEGLDSVHFAGGMFKVDINNGTELPLRLDLAIIGKNSRSGVSVSMPVLVDRLNPGNTTLNIPDTVGLAGILPDTISVTGSAGLGVKFFQDMIWDVITIEEDQGFTGTFELVSGLQFSLGQTQIKSDLADLSSKIDYPVQALELSVRITNTVPLGGTVMLMMGNDTTNMTNVLGESVRIPVGQFDPNTHRVIEPGYRDFSFDFGPDLLDIMRVLPVYTQQIINFDGTDGDTVWLYADDSLAVKAFARIFYTVDVEGGDDE